MRTEGDFGREKRNPPGRPSLLGKCFSDSEAERVPVFPSNRRIQQDVLCQLSVLSNTLAENTPTTWTTPRATLCMVHSKDYLMDYPLLLGEKLFDHPHTPTNKNLLAFTITIGRHLGSYNLWAYSSLVMLSKLLKKSNNWVYLDART